MGSDGRYINNKCKIEIIKTKLLTISQTLFKYWRRLKREK
jgi:hypothetical protein